MSREGRTITLAITTIFVYALSNLLQKGALIFPFPLNEIIFLISSLAIGYYQFRNTRLLSILFVITAFFNLLSNEFYWAIIFNTEEMHHFSKSIITDLFKALYYLGIIFLIFISLLKRQGLYRFFVFIPIFGIIYSSFFHFPTIEILVYLFVSIITFRFVKQSPIMNLWILLFVLEVTKLWSLIG